MNQPKKAITSISPVIRDTLKNLQEKIEDNPDDNDARVLLDGALHQLLEGIYQQDEPDGDDQLTVALLEELVTLLPQELSLFRGLAKTFISRKDWPRALEQTEFGLIVDPDDADFLFDRAYCLLEMDEHAQAIGGFDRFLKVEKHYPWAYNNIGACFRNLGQYDKAEEYFKRAIQIDETFLPAYQNLSLLYTDIRDPEKAAYFAGVVVHNSPSDQEARLILGDALMGMKKPKLALEHLVTATLIDRDFVEAYETMAAAYTDIGMFELAVAAAKEALRINPQSWMALANWGYALNKQDDFEQAIELSLKALALRPGLESMYKLCWEIGWMYFRVGQSPNALEYTNKALGLKQDPDLMLWFNKGLIHLTLGQEQEARAAYDQAIDRFVAIQDDGVVMEAIQDLEDYVTGQRLFAQKESGPMTAVAEEIQKAIQQHLDGWFAVVQDTEG